MNKFLSIICLFSLLLSAPISRAECVPQNEATYRKQIIGTWKELGRKNAYSTFNKNGHYVMKLENMTVEGPYTISGNILETGDDRPSQFNHWFYTIQCIGPNKLIMIHEEDGELVFER